MPQITVQGERWFPSEKSFAEDMPHLWGDWYCDSEVGKLHTVLLRRPGAEIDIVNQDNYTQFRWKSPMQTDRARRQQDVLAQLYREHGVQVHYVENMRPDRPNALYLRDLIVMTPEGAIVCRPGIEARRGEERYVAEQLAKLGVPILKTINGDGYFDGACAMWVDRQTVIIGTGARANKSGAAQVEAELRNIGVTDFIHFEIPYGHAHIDGLLNICDKKKAVLFPWQVPYDVVKPLLDRDFTIIEATNLAEVKESFCTNFVALEPGKVLMPAGNPETKAKMEDAGVTVIEVEMDEIMKGWGAIHCMTVFLRRDPIGSS
ncbi:dimethylarginine dimethylaminohydrolase family protein [Brevibacillus fulvus]|uniref:N-dimethylarginine dimethylaminohydrolase n=1 Tax=Brevibacillus fulvus TaxID=1125967 RepID=A0A939BTZ4_9BACL|nr:arginine deiminase family protein [Brevibacillus fulvus]MBM7588976.1 N-dimethylarginine dimethylaminohydrolase [Brevibacillus fulvus]